MKKIVLVSCYFGPLPMYFPYWAKTCETNPSIDFIVYTDQEYKDVLPENVFLRKTSLAEVRKLACEKLNRTDLSLETPYKLCDYKPLYGLIFQDDLRDYKFFGHSDLDLFLGNLSEFITEDMLETYDKIFPLGHLSLYRNTPEVHQRFFLPGGKYDPELVLTSPKNFCYDEWPGMYAIYVKHGFPFYSRNCFAAISKLRKRFSLQARTSEKYPKPAPDYPHQVFFWDRGAVRRAFLDHGTVRYDDFAYTHLFRRPMFQPDFAPEEVDAFFITQKGLLRKEPGENVTEKQIRTLNPYYGKLYEYLEAKIRRKIMKRKNHKVFAGRDLMRKTP